MPRPIELNIRNLMDNVTGKLPDVGTVMRWRGRLMRIDEVCRHGDGFYSMKIIEHTPPDGASVEDVLSSIEAVLETNLI